MLLRPWGSMAVSGWLSLAVGLSMGTMRMAIADEPQFDLNSGNIATWQKRILPTEEEMTWAKIGWRENLRSGIEEAARSGKPVLLWTMNGHPLGCT